MPFLSVLFTSFVKLGSSQRGLFSFHCWGSFSLSASEKSDLETLILHQGGAANFCMQKFLTGLVGLVYLIIDFHSLAEKLKKDVSGSFD